LPRSQENSWWPWNALEVPELVPAALQAGLRNSPKIDSKFDQKSGWWFQNVSNMFYFPFKKNTWNNPSH